jgi:hypothetical protein
MVHRARRRRRLLVVRAVRARVRARAARLAGAPAVRRGARGRPVSIGVALAVALRPARRLEGINAGAGAAKVAGGGVKRARRVRGRRGRDLVHARVRGGACGPGDGEAVALQLELGCCRDGRARAAGVAQAPISGRPMRPAAVPARGHARQGPKRKVSAPTQVRSRERSCLKWHLRSQTTQRPNPTPDAHRPVRLCQQRVLVSRDGDAPGTTRVQSTVRTVGMRAADHRAVRAVSVRGGRRLCRRAGARAGARAAAHRGRGRLGAGPRVQRLHHVVHHLPPASRPSAAALPYQFTLPIN